MDDNHLQNYLIVVSTMLIVIGTVFGTGQHETRRNYLVSTCFTALLVSLGVGMLIFASTR